MSLPLHLQAPGGLPPALNRLSEAKEPYKKRGKQGQKAYEVMGDGPLDGPLADHCQHKLENDPTHSSFGIEDTPDWINLTYVREVKTFGTVKPEEFSLWTQMDDPLADDRARKEEIAKIRADSIRAARAAKRRAKKEAAETSQA